MGCYCRIRSFLRGSAQESERVRYTGEGVGVVEGEGNERETAHRATRVNIQQAHNILTSVPSVFGKGIAFRGCSNDWIAVIFFIGFNRSVY